MGLGEDFLMELTNSNFKPPWFRSFENAKKVKEMGGATFLGSRGQFGNLVTHQIEGRVYQLRKDEIRPVLNGREKCEVGGET